MAENLKKVPKKGILKNSSSFDIQDRQSASRKSKGSTKWDEMNIMATLHPPDKDYGHMKIDEPKTPYNFEGLEPNDVDKLDAADLAERIRKSANEKPKALESSDDDDEDDDEDMTPEQREAKREFENKRKKHYNEFYAVKLARKLLEKDEDDDEEAASSKQ